MRTVTLEPHLQPMAGVSFEFMGKWHRDGVPIGVWLTGATTKWPQGIDGRGVVVGVIDTGIGPHPDLETCPDGRQKILGRRDYVNDGVPPARWHYHGTHVAGTIAANGKVRGVAPGAQLRDYRVLDVQGYGTSDNVALAVLDGVADGCHILNLSLGDDHDNQKLREAVQYAVSQGVLVVVSVGNSGAGTKRYPGYYSWVVGVGAVGLNPTTGEPARQWFSSTNDEVDVCANGVDVLSCAPGGLYMLSAGTSMAAPHVAGVAALARQEAQKAGVPITEPILWTITKGALTRDVEALGIDAGTGAGFVTFWPALPKLRRVAVTTGSTTRTIDGQPDSTPMPLAPRMEPVAGTTEHKTLIPPRETHEPLYGFVEWEELPPAPDGTPRGTATFSRWHIPGAEQGQPEPKDVFKSYTGPV